jgi:hypothetical protein
MVNSLPPNQRRLNAKIKEIHGERYEDWYALALDLYESGGTQQSIADHFAMLGVPVSRASVRKWMRDRARSEETAPRRGLIRKILGT